MFLSELIVKKVSNTKYSYELVADLYYKANTDTIRVPSGFITDFASVPWIFRWFFPVMGTLSDKPAVLHDWLYVTESFDRKTCDELFYKALKERGVSRWKAWSMYKAVRLGGWYVWNKHKKEEVDAMRSLGG